MTIAIIPSKIFSWCDGDCCSVKQVMGTGEIISDCSSPQENSEIQSYWVLFRKEVHLNIEQHILGTSAHRMTTGCGRSF